jgi:hypothetical protein
MNNGKSAGQTIFHLNVNYEAKSSIPPLNIEKTASSISPLGGIDPPISFL